MDLPQVFVFDESEHEDHASHELARTIAALGFEAPFVVASVHGAALASRLTGSGKKTPPPAADQAWAASVGSHAGRSGADAIVAIGGGRCLDVAKLAAGRAGVPIVAAPTQLAHDGICSPVAVVPGADGRAESLGAIAPTAVFISIPTLMQAPSASVAAGLGDLLANPLALRDWSLAVERGLDGHDQRAWDLSVQSFELVEPYLDDDPAAASKDPAFLRRLADALILSGMAMMAAGSSRPASGGEHEISHAIDELHGGRALHGAQVAFGCIVSAQLYGDDTSVLRDRLRNLGLPDDPVGLGFDEDELVELLLHAPTTRPGRYTILEHADLDAAGYRRLIDEIWGG